MRPRADSQDVHLSREDQAFFSHSQIVVKNARVSNDEESSMGSDDEVRINVEATSWAHLSF